MFLKEKLRRCREALGLTQTDLIFELDKIGFRVSRPTVDNWESGKTTPDANDLALMARFFEKPVQYFFAK